MFRAGRFRAAARPRKIAVAMTLWPDGYFQGPDHDLSWHLFDGELHAHFNEQLANNGASKEGRVSASKDGVETGSGSVHPWRDHCWRTPAVAPWTPQASDQGRS